MPLLLVNSCLGILLTPKLSFQSHLSRKTWLAKLAVNNIWSKDFGIADISFITYDFS